MLRKLLCALFVALPPAAGFFFLASHSTAVAQQQPAPLACPSNSPGPVGLGGPQGGQGYTCTIDSNGKLHVIVDGGGGGGGNTTIVAPTDAAGRLIVVTPPPNASIGVPTVIPSCPAVAYPCGFPTPYPALTCPPEGAPCGGMLGPSAAPAVIGGGGYRATVDSSGNQHMNICPPGGGAATCVVQTPLPGVAGYAAPTTNIDPVAAMEHCYAYGSAPTVTAGNVNLVGCGNAAHGVALDTALCNGAAASDAGVACAKVAVPADTTTASNSASTLSFSMVRDSTINTWYMLRAVKNTTGVLSSFPGTGTRTQLSAAAAACTSGNTNPGNLVMIWYVSTAAQTGTLTIYDEGASPTCNAADVVYTSATHTVITTPEMLYMPLTAGWAYKWTTNAEVGLVYVGTFP